MASFGSKKLMSAEMLIIVNVRALETVVRLFEEGVYLSYYFNPIAPV